MPGDCPANCTRACPAIARRLPGVCVRACPRASIDQRQCERLLQSFTALSANIPPDKDTVGRGTQRWIKGRERIFLFLDKFDKIHQICHRERKNHQILNFWEEYFREFTPKYPYFPGILSIVPPLSRIFGNNFGTFGQTFLVTPPCVFIFSIVVVREVEESTMLNVRL